MFTLKRVDMINWSCGTLLHFENGKGVAVDEHACMEAERRMGEGETIGLTSNGEIVTTMRLYKDGYREKKYNGDTVRKSTKKTKG